jgi:phospholipase C
VQEIGTRRARPVPIALAVTDSVVPLHTHTDGAQPPPAAPTTQLHIINQHPTYGVALTLFDELQLQHVRPRQYALAANSQLSDVLTWNTTAAIAYAVSLHGSNGFVRQLAARNGAVAATAATVAMLTDSPTLTVSLTLFNTDPTHALFYTVIDEAYDTWPAPVLITVPPNGQHHLTVDVSGTNSYGWYDLTVQADTTTGAPTPAWYRRYMGHVENGQESSSDPAMAAGKPIATSALSGLNGVRAFVHPPNHPLSEPLPVPRMAGTHWCRKSRRRGVGRPGACLPYSEGWLVLV